MFPLLVFIACLIALRSAHRDREIAERKNEASKQQLEQAAQFRRQALSILRLTKEGRDA